MHRRHRHLLPKTRRDGLLSPDSHRRIARLSSTSRDYNPGMRVGPLLCSPLAAVLCSHALAYPGPPRGTENIPKLMADSALVCKGEVVEAAEVTVVSDPRPPHRTATAIVHVDRCFKRSEEHTSELQSRLHLVCRLLLEKKKTTIETYGPCSSGRLTVRATTTARQPRFATPCTKRQGRSSSEPI